MHPTLAEVFGEPIPAYFTLLLIGFAVATWLAATLARRQGIDPNVFIDLGLFSVIFGLIGARLLHVIADGFFWDYVHLCTDPARVAWEITEAQCRSAEGVWDAERAVCRPSGRDCFGWLAFWRGGLTYYGGLVVATVFGIWFLKRENVPIRQGADIAGVAIAVGLVFGRIGCFLGGCCFGLHTEHAFGLRFPAFSPASESQWRAKLLAAPGLESLPVHPTQLYEAIGCTAIAAFLLWFLPRKRFDGQVMLAFIALYAILRFGIEFVRADDRGVWLSLSTSQLIGLLALATVSMLWLSWRRAARPAATG